ncbi:hypothetical protein D3C73_1124440 [compost metagenome]
MSRDQHRAPLIAQFAQQVDDAGLGFHVYAGERFIQQNDLSVLGDGARQKNTFFLPTGEFADLPMAVFQHIDPRQRRIHGLMVARGWSTQPAHMAKASHHHHVFHQHRK